MLTVLMPLYNGGKLLRQSIASVLNQSWRDFEFLIVDDCSTDDSVEVVRSFRDQRIVLHHNEKNLGQSRSLNAGLERAKGEYIARIDADDLALPHWLAGVMNAVRQHPEAAVISPSVAVIDEQNKIRKRYPLPEAKTQLILRSLVRSPVNHVGSIVRRQTALKLGGYDPQYRVAADFDLWGKMLRSGEEIIALPEILMAIREHSGSLTKARRVEEDIDELAAIMKKNIDYFCSFSVNQQQVRQLAFAFYYPQSLTTKEFEEAMEFLQQITQNLHPELNASAAEVRRWEAATVRNVYVRKIFATIKERNYDAVRILSRSAVRRFGRSAVFTVLLLFSYFDGLLNLVPALYESLNRRRVLYQLRDYLKTVQLG